MHDLALYLTKRMPKGLNYREAAQLCQRLFISHAGVPDEVRPQNGDELAGIFVELAQSGWVQDQESHYRILYGAHWHKITTRGHWIEVMACTVKNAERVDLRNADLVAELAGFKRMERS